MEINTHAVSAWLMVATAVAAALAGPAGDIANTAAEKANAGTAIRDDAGTAAFVSGDDGVVASVVANE